MVKKKSITNTTFFEDIPKTTDLKELLLMKCKVRSKLREDREVLVMATREERKRIYNLSQEIEQIDRDIDKLLLR